MAAQEQQSALLKQRQHSDDENETATGCLTHIPESWKLTQQQQAFIDSFADDEQQKQ
ncbi:hypothetical protein CJP72_23440 [Citrobacter sp. NCU1]|uniref:hypothetical protein n=1 Tax=Citrobacter sp. NCU1 TaxID=2026683 RepID=UPI001EE2513D|nr:hypothetical protein [Citrobacter sp. NCU1]NDO83596.1 hypothetical protein [Citrobacter sp. NCU1]